MDKLYIVVPAYNEEENIEALINDWYPIEYSAFGVPVIRDRIPRIFRIVPLAF